MKKLLIIVSLFISFTPELTSQWIGLSSPSSGNVTGMHFKDTANGFVSFVTGTNSSILYATTDGGAGWFQVFSGGRVNCVSIWGQTNGAAMGLSGYIFTTNGGTNWTGNLSQLNSYYDVCYINSNTAYAVGYRGYMPPNNGELIFKSTNGGANWSNISTSGDYTLYSIHFFSGIGYICGTGGRILKTDNGGATWTPSPSGVTETLYGVFATSTTNAYIVGANSTVLRTTNWGSNWDNLNIGVSGLMLKAVYFTDAQTGYICGSSGYIGKTTNSGANWDQQGTNLSVTLNQIFFANHNTGYAAGDGGVILKTTNGGVIAINPISTEVPKDFSLYQNYPNPFNPATNIRFAVPKATNIKLAVFDMLGREVETLVNESLILGMYEVKWDAARFSSGIYFYRIVSNNFSEVKKMSVIK